jgi:hypothetical protein
LGKTSGVLSWTFPCSNNNILKLSNRIFNLIFYNNNILM